MNRCGPTRRYLATGDDYEYIADMSEDLNVKREIILEADAETLVRTRKEGHVRGFTAYADSGSKRWKISGQRNTVI